MSDTIAKLRELLLNQSRTGRLRGLLDSIYGAASTGAEAYGSASSPMSAEHSGLLGGLLMDMSPLGDAKSAYDGVQAAREGDWLGAGLGGLGALPMVPNMTKLVPRHGIPFDVDALHGSPTSGLSRLLTTAPPAASKGVGDEGVGVVWGTTNKFNAKDYSGGATIDVQSPVNQFGGKEGSIYKVKTKVNNPYVVKDLGDTSPYSRKVHIDYARAHGHDAVIFRQAGQKDYEVALFNDVDVAK